MTQNLRVQELDFDTIKENLKEFMRSKPEFSDYDFEGSGISALLNILAYNTHYTAVLANMQMNELFLDTASKRTTAALHASRLGYVPGSMKSPLAKVNLEIFTGSNTPATLTIGKGAIFNALISGTNYQFVTTEARTINRSSSGRYVFDNLEIREGTIKAFRYQYLQSNPVRFVVPSKNVDINTLKVKVQVSSTNSSTAIYNLNKSIVDNQATSQIYYLRLNQAGFYEVSFGDGIVSKAIEDGNIVILEYIETNGKQANGATLFTFADNVQGYSSNLVTTVIAAFGGDDPQSIESIKISAQAALTSQNRAVTESDYKTAIQEVYPVESIAVWGGEKNNPPIYGRVFISMKPTGGGQITEATKQYIADEIIRKKNVVTVTPQFVDPKYTYIQVDSNVYYDADVTDYSALSMSAVVAASIASFGQSNLGKFDNVLRFSKLSNAIDQSSPAILSNITKLKLYKYVVPEFVRDIAQTLDFGNAIVPGSVDTLQFYIGTVDSPVYIDDVDGILRVYYKDVSAKKVVIPNAGTVNYETGRIVLNQLFVTSQQELKIMVVPKTNDIFSIRENILMLESSDINVTSIVDSADASDRIYR